MREINSMRAETRELLENASVSREMRETWHVCIIEKIHEVLHFENKSTDLWKSYIQKFMKIKLETSPFSCSEGEYREKAKKFDIELDKLEENPGLRFIAKICLNSLWGKFGQNPKEKHTEYIDNEADFYRVILDDKIENISLFS